MISVQCCGSYFLGNQGSGHCAASLGQSSIGGSLRSSSVSQGLCRISLGSVSSVLSNSSSGKSRVGACLSSGYKNIQLVNTFLNVVGCETTGGIAVGYLSCGWESVVGSFVPGSAAEEINALVNVTRKARNHNPVVGVGGNNADGIVYFDCKGDARGSGHSSVCRGINQVAGATTVGPNRVTKCLIPGQYLTVCRNVTINFWIYNEVCTKLTEVHWHRVPTFSRYSYGRCTIKPSFNVSSISDKHYFVANIERNLTWKQCRRFGTRTCCTQVLKCECHNS